MARPLRLDVTSDTSDARRGLDQVADNLERAGRTAERMGQRFTTANANSRALGRGLDNLGDQARGAARDVEHLGDKLDSLGKKGIGSGTTSGLAGIVARFTKLGERSASGFGGAFTSGVSSLASNVPLLAGVAVVGSVLGGVLAGALVSGVLLGLGGGVLITGLISAFKDPAVDQALRGQLETFSHGLNARARKGQPFTPAGSTQQVRVSEGLIDKASKLFTQLGKPFVGPLVAALDATSKLLDRIGPKLETLFGSLTPAVEPLFKMLGDIVEGALPGLQKAAEASIPIIEKLAEHGPQIGEMLTKIFTTFAEVAPQAAVALGDILDFVEVLLPHLAELLAGFVLLWVGIRDGATATKDFVVEAFTWLTQRVLEHIGTLINAAAKAWYWVPGLGPKLEKAASDFNAFATRVNMALQSIKDRDVSVRVRMSQTNIGGVRVPVGESGTIPIRGAYAEGGPVPGPAGMAQLAVVHGGEFVLSREMLAGAKSMRSALISATGSGGGPARVTVDFAGVSQRAGSMDAMLAQWFLYNLRVGQIALRVGGGGQVVPG